MSISNKYSFVYTQCVREMTLRVTELPRCGNLAFPCLLEETGESKELLWRGERWPFGVQLPSVQQERARLSTRITCAHNLESRPCRG